MGRIGVHARGWIACTGLALGALLANHEAIRLQPVVAKHPLLHLSLVGVLVAGSVLAWFHYRRTLTGLRPLDRRVALACGLLLVAVSAIALLIGVANWKVATRANKIPDAVLTFHSPDVLAVRGRIKVNLLPQMREALELHTETSTVVIDSSGGQVAAAENVGRYLRELGVTVRVDGRCASACVPLWALARQRQMTEGSRIGLHRAHLGNLAAERGIARGALEARSDASMALLRAIGFSQALIERAKATPANAVLWLDAAQLKDQGVRFDLIAKPPTTEPDHNKREAVR